MNPPERSWQEKLEIVDRTMKAVSDITDPEEMVDTYWNGIGDLLPGEEFLALSRRNVPPPFYLITRSSRFTEHFNPWTQREKLPRLTGGLLGEIAFADKPVIIDDIPSRLRHDDPAHFYLQGYQSLFAFPQYEGGRGINIGITLFFPGQSYEKSILPMVHWQGSLFGRGTYSLVLRNQLSKALGDLDLELKAVAEIQRSLLPQQLPVIPGFEMAAHYETSQRAGGDYYDFFPLDRDRVGIFIADVSGHGTPAAVLMAVTHAIAHTRPGFPTPPGELLGHLNFHLARSYTTSGTFVTAFYAALDPTSRLLSYARAGHNPPRILRDDSIISLDGTHGLPLGIIPEESFKETTIQLERGDLLLLYTDGITEAMAPPTPDGHRELFGVERLDAILRAHRTEPPEQILQGIRDAVAQFTENAPRADDQTLIVIRCK
jgi:sigma-B regulation protein RsbU (phosphoserine phosphatase)